MSDDELIETEETLTLRREDAADRLRAIADQLSRHNSLELSRGGLKMTAKVPDQVELGIEIEITDEGGELEIELKW
jgi:amphi-Trp domain-containing protein